MTGSDGSALRADARRNREQIIDAARALFVHRGVGVPLEEVARSAGVGVGTLYRRFPDREELIRAVGVDSFERLRDLAQEIEKRGTEPHVALQELLRSTLELRLGLTLSVLSPLVLDAVMTTPPVADIRAELFEVMDRWLSRAQEAGTLRADIAAGDVLLSIMSLARLVSATPNELGEMVFERLFALIFDGMRTTPGDALPGRPISFPDLDDLRASGMLGHRRT